MDGVVRTKKLDKQKNMSVIEINAPIKYYHFRTVQYNESAKIF